MPSRRLRTPPRHAQKVAPTHDAKVVDGLKRGEIFRKHYPYQAAEFCRSPGSNIKRPTQRRPPKLTLSDFECVKALDQTEHCKVLLVKTMRRSHEHDLAGCSFALKAFDKKRVRSFDSSNPSAKNVERCNLSQLAWNPFVNNAIDAFHDARNIYMLLEDIPCGTLRSLIHEHGPFDATSAMFYFSNIACALAFLQDYNIVHRDINPDNILVGADGYLCLSDFTKAIVPSDDQSFQHWILVGSLAYAAPECVNPVAVGPLTYGSTVDWWSSGCIFFELLTGRPAFPVNNDRDGAVLDKILQGRVNWPVNGARIGRSIKLLVESFLVVHPSNRLGYNGCEEVFNHLYFGNITWDMVANRQYIAPYVPPFPHAADEWHNHPLPRQSQIPGLRIAAPPILLEYDERFAVPQSQ